MPFKSENDVSSQRKKKKVIELIQLLKLILSSKRIEKKKLIQLNLWNKKIKQKSFDNVIITSIDMIERKINIRENAEIVMQCAVKAKQDGYSRPPEYYVYLERCIEKFVVQYPDDITKKSGLYKAFNISGTNSMDNQKSYWLTRIVKELVSGYIKGEEIAKQEGNKRHALSRASIHDINFSDVSNDKGLELTYEYALIVGYKNKTKITPQELNRELLMNFMVNSLDYTDSTAKRLIKNYKLVNTLTNYLNPIKLQKPKSLSRDPQ